MTEIQDHIKKYWTQHNVTNHFDFSSVKDSLDFFDWRNKCYLYYQDLMPTHHADDKVVLDYGCGPGHDLVGFTINSKPKRLIAADVSTSSLKQAEKRLNLHNTPVEIIEIPANRTTIPLENHSVDLIHSSGVLHHTDDPLQILQEFRRILKPNGTLQIMVYNYHSIWVHLYVAYECMIQDGSFKNNILRKLRFKEYPQDLKEAFRITTDGPGCPVSRFYKREEFIHYLNRAGFYGEYKGASISLWMEMNRLPKRFAAITDRRLPQESRDFLYNLTFDERDVPFHEGFCAGIGGCYKATPYKK